MKAKNIVILVAVVAVLISILYTVYGSKDQTAYVNIIKKERESKDTFMRTSPESPFAGNVDSFTGLKYYTPDLKYKVVADLTPIQNKKSVFLTTNDGKQERYVEYGYAEFDMTGYHNKLLILEMVDDGPSKGKLFLAFGDGTSAEETYGAGRYLDIEKAIGSNTITLDFNQAYNPYCAYSEKFSCPLPPQENLLVIPIPAGEKSYHE
jgi:uncharacterized protein (DUF1684 family)